MTSLPLPPDSPCPIDDVAAKDRLRLLRRAFQQCGEAILIADRDDRIVAVNPAFTVMSGFAEAELIGQDPWQLIHGHTTRDESAVIRHALIEHGAWSGGLWYRRKDGTLYPLDGTITALRDEQEQIAYVVGTFSDLTVQRASTDHIIHLAHHDALTGLLNRHALYGQLERLLAGARREHGQLALLLIDLDRFKDINDTLGHPVGDRLLIEVASRLSGAIRASDIVARLGGDEFVIVLPNIENPLTVATLASKLRRSLSDIYRIGEHSLYATPSIGITLFPGDGDSADTLIKNADSAMYHAKAAGRDNFKFFTPSMNAAAIERLNLETALRQALEAGTLTGTQFRLEFQPQRHLHDGRIVGIEALARWRHPQLGEISPARFIPVAEETGLILPLGDWVFWEACRQMRIFKDHGVRNLRIAVNLSAQQLREEELPTLINGALTCYDLQPGELELEITESTAMRNPEMTIAILQQLSDIGIVLAVDDFGTGYSSLSYLKQLPIHRLKLDRSLVKDVTEDNKGAAICAATVVLGHKLGLDLVAEGVETSAQEDHLRQIGCDVMQGFLFSRPMPADQTLAFLLRHQAQ